MKLPTGAPSIPLEKSYTMLAVADVTPESPSVSPTSLGVVKLRVNVQESPLSRWLPKIEAKSGQVWVSVKGRLGTSVGSPVTVGAVELADSRLMVNAELLVSVKINEPGFPSVTVGIIRS